MPRELEPSGSSSPDLEQLMARYQRGEAAALEALIDLLAGKLYDFFSSHMGNRSQADDMLQELWLKLHQARHTYRPGEPVLPWIYAIARRVRVDNYRRRVRIERREVASDAIQHFPEASPASALPCFGELLATLPESQREVLIMLKVNGLSLEEAARATSSTVGSVKQKVHRAYERLRKLLPNTRLRQADTGGRS